MSSKQHSAKARLKKPSRRRNRRTRRVWVSRDHRHPACYNITSEEPSILSSYWGRWHISDTGYASCDNDPETFEHLMGIKLKPGECRQFDMLVTMTPVSKMGAK